MGKIGQQITSSESSNLPSKLTNPIWKNFIVYHDKAFVICKICGETFHNKKMYGTTYVLRHLKRHPEHYHKLEMELQRAKQTKRMGFISLLKKSEAFSKLPAIRGRNPRHDFFNIDKKARTAECLVCRKLLKARNLTDSIHKHLRTHTFENSICTQMRIQEVMHGTGKRKPRSVVWQFFTRINDSVALCNECGGRVTSLVWNFFTRIDDSKASCNLCNSAISRRSGQTKGMRTHLGRSALWNFFTDSTPPFSSKQRKEAMCNLCLRRIPCRNGATSGMICHLKHHPDAMTKYQKIMEFRASCGIGNNCEFVHSGKAGSLLVCSGHCYRKKSEYKNQSYWRCTVRTCPAHGLLRRGSKVFQHVNSEHNHGLRKDFLKRKQIYTQLYRAMQSGNSTEDILKAAGSDRKKYEKFLNNQINKDKLVKAKKKIVEVGQNYEQGKSLSHGKPVIYVQGYKFRLERILAKNEEQTVTKYWRCTKKSCRARGITTTTGFTLTNPEHNHPPDQPEFLQSTSFFKQLQEAANDTERPLTEVFAELKVVDPAQKRYAHYLRKMAMKKLAAVSTATTSKPSQSDPSCDLNNRLSSTSDFSGPVEISNNEDMLTFMLDFSSYTVDELLNLGKNNGDDEDDNK